MKNLYGTYNSGIATKMPLTITVCYSNAGGIGCVLSGSLNSSCTHPKKWAWHTTSTTRYYAPSFEREISNGQTTDLTYIQSPNGFVAAVKTFGGKHDAMLLATDHLGSIVGVWNASGTLLEEHRYTAWGQRTSSTASPRLRRGFTGHEHLAQFGLIDMKARLYDPHLGQFLEPDPYVQAPEKPMSYNRYAYCLNNPLRYTDPSGYIHAPAVPYDNDRDIIEDPWWSGCWALAIGRGTPLAWTTRIPSVGGFGSSVIVTRVTDAWHGAYRVSSTGRYQTVDIFGAHGGYTRYVSPWLGANGPTATHFFYDLSPGTTANSWGYSPSLNDCMGGSVAGEGSGWSRGGYGGGGYGGYGGGGSGGGDRTGGGLRLLDRLDGANSFISPITDGLNLIGTAAERSLRASSTVDAATGVLKGVKVAGKGLGWAGAWLSLGVNLANVVINPTPGNIAQGVVSAGIVGIGMLGPAGAITAFVLSSVDAAGGFDDFYEWIDVKFGNP